MRLALRTDLTRLRDDAPGAARAGFAGMTLRCPDDPRTLDAGGRREVRHAVAKHGLAPAALRLDLPGRGLWAEADGDRVVDVLRRAAELARDVGFETVACDLGVLPRSAAPARRSKPIDPAAAGLILLPSADDVAEVAAPPAPLSDREKRHAAFAADVLVAVGGVIDRVGVRVAFGSSLASTADLAATLASADCPLFDRDLDPASAVAELADDPDVVVKLAPRVGHVRAADAVRGGDRTRPAAVGQGDVPWPDLLASLRDADFDGWITCPNAAALTALRT